VVAFSRGVFSAGRGADCLLATVSIRLWMLGRRLCAKARGLGLQWWRHRAIPAARLDLYAFSRLFLTIFSRCLCLWHPAVLPVEWVVSATGALLSTSSASSRPTLAKRGGLVLMQRGLLCVTSAYSLFHVRAGWMHESRCWLNAMSLQVYAGRFSPCWWSRRLL